MVTTFYTFDTMPFDNVEKSHQLEYAEFIFRFSTLFTGSQLQSRRKKKELEMWIQEDICDTLISVNDCVIFPRWCMLIMNDLTWRIIIDNRKMLSRPFWHVACSSTNRNYSTTSLEYEYEVSKQNSPNSK